MTHLPETPSELLERAAVLLERIADEAPPPPWRERGLDGSIHAPDPASAKGVEVVAVRTTWGATRWIEVMSPAVAAPLVELLRDAAKRAAAHPHLDPSGSTFQRCALDLARCVLGEHIEEDGRE